MKKIILFFTFSIFLSFYSSAQTTNNEKALEIMFNESIDKICIWCQTKFSLSADKTFIGEMRGCCPAHERREYTASEIEERMRKQSERRLERRPSAWPSAG